MSEERPEFHSGAVRPVECLKQGWQIVKERYWLFFGIVLLAMIIAEFGPFAVLVGPCMCGVFYCFLQRELGMPVKFDMLFRGFDYFVQSMIATLVMLIPLFLVSILGLFVVVPVALIPLFRGNAAGKSDGLLLIAVMSGYLFVLTIIQLVIHVFAFFTYPLIVERKMKGMDALKLSVKAAKANLGGLIGLVLLDFLLQIAGSLVCCIGGWFIMPIHMAAYFVAYRQVFDVVPPGPSADSVEADYRELDVYDAAKLELDGTEPEAK